ncbi:Gfo/Idh/MocA family protein [Sodalis sp. RH21]|uniref:Gfo/Idh/MocA family protein n=1 Tax=unclassified Sodalis (in: enterobacteria) TaxID=2636512 RepID=UPI0039B5568F
MKTAFPLRIGIIGAGAAAETHARELARVEGAVVSAVFSRNVDKGAAFAAAFSIPRFYHRLDAFLSQPALDAVIITTPNGLHLDYAGAAARAGKHVIIEKPLEISFVRALATVNVVDAIYRSAATRLPQKI